MFQRISSLKLKNTIGENIKKRYNSETTGMIFKSTKIEFYDEDLEKMKNMTLSESNSYKLNLKIAGKYINRLF